MSEKINVLRRIPKPSLPAAAAHQPVIVWRGIWVGLSKGLSWPHLESGDNGKGWPPMSISGGYREEPEGSKGILKSGKQVTQKPKSWLATPLL